jgi:hypothetical protein
MSAMQSLASVKLAGHTEAGPATIAAVVQYTATRLEPFQAAGPGQGHIRLTLLKHVLQRHLTEFDREQAMQASHELELHHACTPCSCHSVTCTRHSPQMGDHRLL